jgi:pimeloyl-ACP methyl ester carboxylesterase
MKTRKGYADGPCGQVHFQVAGDGFPLLLLHQSPSSSEMFGAVFGLLADAGIQSIAIDTPGYGQSDTPDEPPTIADYAAAIPPVMDQLDIRKAGVLGHHTGASIACELAVAEPDRITHVILNGPPLMTEEERDGFREALKNSHERAIEPDGSHLKATWDQRIYFTPGWTSLEAMHIGVVQMLIAGLNGKEWYGHNAAFAHDMAVPLQALRQPGLILTNTGDDIYYAAARARELRPDFAYVELKDGTHDIVDEQPENWTAAVAAYLLD